MTKTELKENGWSPQACKIGTLFFKGNFFCRFINDDTVTVMSTSNDMLSLGKATTLDELKNIQKEYDKEKIREAKRRLEELLQAYKINYNEDITNDIFAI